MSGRVAPQDVVAKLYRAADDTVLPWLDELMITAGLLRRCACGSTAPADERCDHCGLGDEPDVFNYFEVYRCEPEATFTVPALTAGDPPLQIRTAAAGGGTLGRAYANNGWIYDVVLAGALVCSGADLRSGGLPRTRRWPPSSPSNSPTAACRRCTSTGSGSACGPARSFLTAGVAADEVVTDDRFSGWRARLVHDDWAHEPDGDALVPALLIARRGQPHLATGVYVPAHRTHPSTARPAT